MLLSIVLVTGMYVGMRLNEPFKFQHNLFSFRSSQFNKINDVVNYINQEYVDTVNQKRLVENTIEVMLRNLDPHSVYVSADDLQAMNEPLEGNFEGIGIEFHIQSDTIMVVSAVAGGPAEQLGIRSGDRIVQVNGKNVGGIGITNLQVTQQLRGASRSKVNVGILRRGVNSLVEYTITRGKIPIYSVDVSYMLDQNTGYIKISHFAERTYEEYLEGFMKLKNEGMKNLVLDLRGNPGGYLKAAIQIADEFLAEKKLIVYTQGRSRPRETYYASGRGYFEKGQLVVLVDEGSASASEIVAGALQDQDRATVIGRRSFGKGLVQEQNEFSDGSAIRLTIARYYTPTGRSIQKPYVAGFEEYQHELFDRMKKGELGNTDSIKFPDSLRFITPAGKIVYGGGGIMPDVFVPLDTTGTSTFYINANSKGLVTQFAYDYLDENRSSFERYKAFTDFQKRFLITDEMYRHFIAFTMKNGVPKDEEGQKLSSRVIKTQLRALIARQIWKNNGFYPIIGEMDLTLKKAMELIGLNEVASR